MALIVNGATQGGGASLPTTPGLALLDAGAASRVLVLNASGEGDTEAYDTVGITALSEILGGEIEGDFVVSDGAGGVQLASEAPAAVRTVLGVGGASVDCDGDAPAWADTAGLGGATFTGGSATFTVPSGVSVVRADGPRSTVALSALGLADPWRVRVEARLLTYDASGQRRAMMGVSSVASIADAAYGAGDFGVFVTVLNAGELTLYDFVGATFALRVTSSIVLALDGQDWLALEVRGAYLTLLHGRGTSRPTSWVLAATAVWSGGVGGTRAVPPAYALLGSHRPDTTASVFTATWSSVRAMDLP